MTENSAAGRCGEIRALLSPFLADELSASESSRVQQHLDACPPCARFQRFEDAFSAAMERTVGATAAPASLVVKIHRALDEEDAGDVVRLRRAMERPWVRGAAAAAAVLLLVVGPGIVGLKTGILTLPVSVAGVILSSEGTLVCAECTRVGRPVSEQRGCRAHGHHAALRTDDGALWEFVDSNLSRPLILDADHLGDRLQVEGLFIDNLHYVRLDAYRYLGGGESQQGL
jgi:hypothetical protein